MTFRVKVRWGRPPDGRWTGASDATSIEVRPLPGESTLEWRRRRGGSSWVFPDEQVLSVGQHVVLTGSDARPRTTMATEATGVLAPTMMTARSRPSALPARLPARG